MRSGLLDARGLERLYGRYNHRRHRSSDPIEFVYRYAEPCDREVAALVTSSLAFGTVKQIRESVARALAPLGGSPAGFIADAPPGRLCKVYRGFKHRWIAGDDMAALLGGMRSIMALHGTLGKCFAASIEERDRDVAPAAHRFVSGIRNRSEGFRRCLLPSPIDGSACKRLFLFLRWMVRRDEIDTGLWSGVPASMLLVPLDTHLYRLAVTLGFTSRRTPDLEAVREVTARFRKIAPEDPVKYDFALAHEGMRGRGTADHE
jgi:uncharacterized protein (TIGR02757 family)